MVNIIWLSMSMVKEFWLNLAYFIITLTVMLLFVFNPFSKHNSVPSIPQDKSNLSEIFTGYTVNFEDRESVKSCLDEYKDKLREYEFAITEAQNHLDEAYSHPSPNYSELFDIIKATQDELDINLLNSPSCY